MPRRNPSPSELGEQYRDGSNLNARVRLHRDFSTNPQGLWEWMFERLAIPPRARVLELGSGTGAMWQQVGTRVPAGWRIVLSDLSRGIVAEARAALALVGRRCHTMQIDAQALPFRNRSFDAVLANYMLYHVPDIPRALTEIRRVLKPGGCLYAATLGHAHMRELDDWAARFLSVSDVMPSARRFGLETGLEPLRECFGDAVTVERYSDSLVVTQVEPLMDYVQSMLRVRGHVAERQLSSLAAFIARQLELNSAIRISKDPGMFVCRVPE